MKNKLKQILNSTVEAVEAIVVSLAIGLSLFLVAYVAFRLATG